MSEIVLEDFNGGSGYYKINLSHLNKEQVKEIEALVSKWNPVEESENERIRKEIIKLVHFYYGSSLICKHTVSENEMIGWLEKQGEQKPKKVSIWKHWKDGIAGNGEGKQTYLIKSGLRYSISSCLMWECDYIELSELDELVREEKPKWSKEDEEEFKIAIETLHESGQHSSAMWLKSIKQRIVQ